MTPAVLIVVMFGAIAVNVAVPEQVDPKTPWGQIAIAVITVLGFIFQWLDRRRDRKEHREDALRHEAELKANTELSKKAFREANGVNAKLADMNRAALQVAAATSPADLVQKVAEIDAAIAQAHPESEPKENP